MLNKIAGRIRLYRKLRFFQYLYLNYGCKNIVRTDQSRVLPYKNAVLDLAPSSRIYVGGGDLEIGCDALKGSKTETLVRLRGNGVWSNFGGCRLSYGATVEVLEHGLLDTGFFTMNTGSVMIAAEKIELGQDVMIGRNVVIYDSDHHAIQNANAKVINPDKPVRIGDHVWLAANVTVLKGTDIGSGCVAGSHAVVHGSIPPDSLYLTEKRPRIRACYGRWSRERP